MKKVVVIMSMLLSLGMFSACSSDDDSLNGNNEKNEGELVSWFNETDKIYISDPNSIIGTWNLKTLCYPEGNYEIPIDDRDLFMFSTNGKVKVVIKKGKSLYPDLPNEDGEYDYSYDKEKQTLQLCGESLKCIISDGEMIVEGSHFGPDDGLYMHEFYFYKIDLR